MKTYTPNVKQFMDKHGIEDIPCYKYHFVDAEALLYHLILIT